MFTEIASDERALVGLHRANEVVRRDRLGGLAFKGQPQGDEQENGCQCPDQGPIYMD